MFLENIKKFIPKDGGSLVGICRVFINSKDRIPHRYLNY